jgi:SulP family sulfate permease
LRRRRRQARPDCLEVLDKAKVMVELNIQEDPHHHIAINKLG